MYPDNRAFEQWEYRGTVCYLVLTSMGHACGYARFPSKPVKEDGYYGILTYVPVHGGITYAEKDDAGMVYGFDCAHSGDDCDPRTWDTEWLKGQCHVMVDAIIAAATVEDEYLATEDSGERGKLLDRYLEPFGGPDMSNSGMLLNLMAGQL